MFQWTEKREVLRREKKKKNYEPGVAGTNWNSGIPFMTAIKYQENKYQQPDMGNILISNDQKFWK